MKNILNLTPEYVFNNYCDVTPDFLHSVGIKALLVDIDNTLAPYEQPDPDERIINWVASLKENGIKIALISNNHPPRVERFNKELGLLAYADSGKPKTKKTRKAMAEMGVTVKETAGLGDQLLTDTLAAHNLGIPSIIVPPIKDKTNPFYKVKRAIERPYIRKYLKSKGLDAELSKKWPYIRNML